LERVASKLFKHIQLEPQPDWLERTQARLEILPG
jgi:hypothetical protein